jgi:hypothetical protein
MSFLGLCSATSSWGDCGFRILYFTPMFTTVFLAGYTLKDMSIMCMFATLGTCLNWLLNLALEYIIRQPAPTPTVDYNSYASQYGMPAFTSQYIVFLFGFFVLFGTLYHQETLPSIHIALTYVMLVMCLFGQIHYNYNTDEQIIVGSAVGALFCIIYMLFVHFFIIPRQAWVEYTARRLLGMKTNNVYQADVDANKHQPTQLWFAELFRRNPFRSQIDVMQDVLGLLKEHLL